MSEIPELEFFTYEDESQQTGFTIELTSGYESIEASDSNGASPRIGNRMKIPNLPNGIYEIRIVKPLTGTDIATHPTDTKHGWKMYTANVFVTAVSISRGEPDGKGNTLGVAPFGSLFFPQPEGSEYFNASFFNHPPLSDPYNVEGSFKTFEWVESDALRFSINSNSENIYMRLDAATFANAYKPIFPPFGPNPDTNIYKAIPGDSEYAPEYVLVDHENPKLKMWKRISNWHSRGVVGGRFSEKRGRTGKSVRI